MEDENSILSRDRRELQDSIMKLDPATAKQMGIYKLYADELGEGFEDPTRQELPDDLPEVKPQEI